MKKLSAVVALLLLAVGIAAAQSTVNPVGTFIRVVVALIPLHLVWGGREQTERSPFIDTELARMGGS